MKDLQLIPFSRIKELPKYEVRGCDTKDEAIKFCTNAASWLHYYNKYEHKSIDLMVLAECIYDSRS